MNCSVFLHKITFLSQTVQHTAITAQKTV